MKAIHFIINPIAGKGRIPEELENMYNFFPEKDYQIRIKISQYAGHATVLAKQSIEEDADIIVACGGDGTINEVASCLVHTEIALGIVPIGSGNGLAASLKIPRNVHKALQVIKNESIQCIDVATLNGKPFLSNMGIGFDAKVISNFNKSKKRKFRAYFNAVIKAIGNHKNTDPIKVEMNGKVMKTSPFMFFVSNSKIMGYDFSLTRMASMQDGWLDVVVIDPLSKGEIVFLGLLLLFRATCIFKKLKYFKVKELKIAFEGERKNYLMQADGELQCIEDRKLIVGLKPQGLRVIAP